MATISIQTKKFADLQNAVTVPDSGLLLVHDGNGVKTISIERLSSVLTYPGAGAHNAICRGKYLGDKVTAAQYAAIDAGTFEDLYIGDYWLIDGFIWRIVAFDYYLNTGDIACTAHHVVIVPDSILYTSQMNATASTEGGYTGSDMYKTGLNQAKSVIQSAFGNNHILSHRRLFVNAVTNGVAAGRAWYDSDIALMNEPMVCGTLVWATSDPASGDLTGVEKSQLPLFAFSPDKIGLRAEFWLRDIGSARSFSRISEGGVMQTNLANTIQGVRPVFSIKAA